MKHWRQGDVLIVQITKPVVLKNPEAKLGDKAVLALGEATGHHHRVEHPGAQLYAVKENLRILVLKEAAPLVHEEHAPIELPAGNFQIITQRENTPLGWMPVVD